MAHRARTMAVPALFRAARECGSGAFSYPGVCVNNKAIVIRKVIQIELTKSGSLRRVTSVLRYPKRHGQPAVTDGASGLFAAGLGDKAGHARLPCSQRQPPAEATVILVLIADIRPA